jgi:hypothetical protein
MSSQSLASLLVYPDLSLLIRKLLLTHRFMLLASDGNTSVYKCVSCRGRCRVDWRSETVSRVGAAYPVWCEFADPRLASLLPALPVTELQAA